MQREIIPFIRSPWFILDGVQGTWETEFLGMQDSFWGEISLISSSSEDAMEIVIKVYSQLRGA